MCFFSKPNLKHPKPHPPFGKEGLMSTLKMYSTLETAKIFPGQAEYFRLPVDLVNALGAQRVGPHFLDDAIIDEWVWNRQRWFAGYKP